MLEALRLPHSFGVFSRTYPKRKPRQARYCRPSKQFRHTLIMDSLCRCSKWQYYRSQLQVICSKGKFFTGRLYTGARKIPQGEHKRKQLRCQAILCEIHIHCGGNDAIIPRIRPVTPIIRHSSLDIIHHSPEEAHFPPPHTPRRRGAGRVAAFTINRFRLFGHCLHIITMGGTKATDSRGRYASKRIVFALRMRWLR